MNMIDITNISDAGLDLLLGNDGVLDGNALRGMSNAALDHIIPAGASASWIESVNDERRQANAIPSGRAIDGPDFEGAILKRQEREMMAS